MSTLEQLRANVERLQLLGQERVIDMPIDELAAVYNGTGPAFLPDEIRSRLDEVTRPFLPAIMVHDVDFARSDGKVCSFRTANFRLLQNCLLCAMSSMTWYSWRRYALVLEAFILYRACQRFGWIPWILAYNQNQRKETNHE